MSDLLIKNGRVVDPANNRDETADVLIRGGKVAEIGPKLQARGIEELDATGKVVCPGFVDLHTHLREPGEESAETIASGTRAAAAGGYTSVAAMANTTPTIDSAADVKFVLERAASTAAVNVFPVAAATKGRKGEQIVEFGDLMHAGAVAFSDDGAPIMNNEVMRRALEYCAMFGAPLLDHCEDLNLSSGGVMREGLVSTRLGLPGIPSVAEYIHVSRDVALADYTEGHVHIMHVTSRRSVSFIGRARYRGVRVTCEATPHHLALTDEALATYDTHFKMNPPLGRDFDRDALKKGLADGVIDCIATDHAPHTAMEKDKVFPDAPFGVIGLETAFSVVYTELVKAGVLTLPQLIAKMTVNPSKVIRVPKGTLSPGADADVAVLDLHYQGKVDDSWFHSLSRNTPFMGQLVSGRVAATIVGGKMVYQNGKILV